MRKGNDSVFLASNPPDGALQKEKAVLEKDTQLITEWTSDLATTLAVANKVSQNFYAESLLKLLGAKIAGKGTTQDGLKVGSEFLKKEVGCEKVELADGCGLSRSDEASPHEVVKLLLYMKRHKHADVFWNSLAIGGDKEGSLKKRFTEDAYKGKIHAKTGHINGVSNLSGYIEVNGDVIVFSILTHDPKGTSEEGRLQDDICKLLLRTFK